MLTVLDIYDAAASIGKDFESLIEKFGPDSVSTLMPKVISVLEELEEYASHFDEDEKEISALHAQILKLESEKQERLQEKDIFNQELGQLEEHWKSETSQLTQLIQKLEDDNQQLKVILNDGQKSESINLQAKAEDSIGYQEIQLMIRLKELIDRQKVEIRGLKRKVMQKSIDLQAVHDQAERLAQINAELRRKHCICKKQADQLKHEKSELKCYIETKNELVRKMSEYVYCPEEQNDRRFREQMLEEDSYSSSDQTNSKLTTLMDPISPICYDKREHFLEKKDSTSSYEELHTLSEVTSLPSNSNKWSDQEIKDRLKTENKIVYDLNDANRPRFTLEELREVLRERNELRSRLVEVEEELAVFSRAGNKKCKSLVEMGSEAFQYNYEYSDDDPPVQGPINREPDDKSESNQDGIKRFTIQNILLRKTLITHDAPLRREKQTKDGLLWNFHVLR